MSSTPVTPSAPIDKPRDDINLVQDSPDSLSPESNSGDDENELAYSILLEQQRKAIIRDRIERAEEARRARQSEMDEKRVLLRKESDERVEARKKASELAFSKRVLEAESVKLAHIKAAEEFKTAQVAKRASIMKHKSYLDMALDILKGAALISVIWYVFRPTFIKE